MRAHVYARTATVATLVGWQVNKVNSPVFPFSSLHRRREGLNILHSLLKQLRISRTANRAQQGFILLKKNILRLLTDLETISI